MMHLRLLMPCSARMREAASSVSADMLLPCLAASCLVCASSWGMVLCTWGMPNASCSTSKTHRQTSAGLAGRFCAFTAQ